METPSTSPHHLLHASSGHGPLNSSTRSLSIFDIPLIVDKIFCALSITDLRNCRLVSKHWSDLSLQGLWKFISLHRQRLRSIKSKDISLLDSQRESTLRYAHWIRTLSVDLGDTLLVDGGEPCRGLRELTIWGQKQQQQQHQRQQEIDNATEAEEGELDTIAIPTPTPPETSWDLIATNSALRSLTLEYSELLLPHLTAYHLNAVLFSSLHALSINFGIHVSTPLAIMTLLHHCPDTLQELSLNNLGGNFWEPSIHVTCPATTPDMTWRVLGSLKSLRIECLMNANLGDAILLPLLKHSCPNLNKFALGITLKELYSSIVETLVVSCPSIDHLEIHELNLPDGEMLRLVQSYIGLQQVDIGVNPSMLDQVIPTLIRTSGATLTRVSIVERRFTRRKHLYSALFLEHCPRLVSLKVQAEGFYNGNESSLRSLVESNSDNGQWVSPVLETLSLSCLIPWDRTPVNRETAVAELTEQLCRKLRDQPRLKSIGLHRSKSISDPQLPIEKEGEDATQRLVTKDRREGIIREYLNLRMEL